MDGLFANQTEQAAKPLEGQLPGADSGATYQSNGMTELSNHVATTNHVSDSPKIAKLENHHSSSPKVSSSSTPSSSKHHSSSSKHHSSSSKDSSKHSSSSSKHHSSSSSSKHSSSSSKHHSSSSSKDPSKHSSSSSKHSSSSSKDPSKHSSSSSKHSSSSSKDPSKHSSSSLKHSSSSSKDPSKHSSSSSKDPSKHSSSSSKDPSKHSSSSSKDPSKHSSSSSKDPSKHSSSSSKHSSSSSKDPSKHSSSSSKDPSKHSSSSSKDPSKHHSSSSKPKDGSSSHSSSSKHKDGSSKHHSSSSKHHSSSSQKPKDGSSASPSKPVKQEFLGAGDASPRAPKLTIKMDGPTKEARLEIKVEQMSPQKIEAMRFSPTKVKAERMDESDDDIPLSDRKKVKDQKPVKRHLDMDSEDEAPLSDRMKKVKKEDKANRKRKHEDEDFTPEVPKKKKKEKKPVKQEQRTPNRSPTKKKGKKEEEARWRWWEDEKKDDGTKWRTLEHRGPVFAPDYVPLPKNVRFYYDGKQMTLTPDTEEVATFYGRMIEHDYTTKDIFNKNFMKDWRKVMTPREREVLTDLKKCNFNEINEHFKRESEARKNRTKQEKQVEKEKNAAITEEYGFCIIDGHKQKIGNFRIEPPGLFRGRGEHPKQGMLKRRTQPEDVIINCSKGAAVPQAPAGHRWKEVRHDNTVTWLCCWSENVQNQTKYVMLSAASKLKGEKDWQKYETARKLHKIADRIRRNYHEDFKSKEMRVRQRAVAMYFIDKLALRAGNEKDEDQADTVGCCSLRVEHLKLHEEMDGKEYMVEFDFLGKDSIRYYNKVQVEKRVFKNLQLFMENKSEGDDLFDRLNTAILNKHLTSLMDGLTAKVFRTYNASKTLQEQLGLLTNPDDPIAAKILSYNRANRAVAVLCNHQRAAPKNFTQQMERMQEKIDAKKEAIRTAKKEVKACKSDLKHRDTNNNKKLLDRKKKAVARLQEQLVKLEVQATDKDENKEIALGTSKLNYLDPRISVAWCKKWEVPIEKIYNKTQRDKFAWAIDMVDADYEF